MTGLWVGWTEGEAPLNQFLTILSHSPTEFSVVSKMTKLFNIVRLYSITQGTVSVFVALMLMS
jgi:hypothetical protein